jgi:hypothetical protein
MWFQNRLVCSFIALCLQFATAIGAITAGQNPDVWRDWKNGEDAIAWAKSQLPNMTDEQLRGILEATQPDPQSGKKAFAFYQRIEAMNEF